ncbi:MAG TPA: PAS domain S-box protein [Bryobacteraceae bacterium]|nr:PAS domain S-box protein [Bryobacteraceae bacterium]
MDRATITLQFPSEFRTLVEDLRAILWEIDYGARKFTWVSRHAEEVLGYPVSEWLETPGFWEDHIHPDDRDFALANCCPDRVEAEDHQLEYRMIRATGQIVWLRQIARVARASSGEISKIRGVMVDITEQREAMQALRESEERFRKVFQDGPIGMIILGCDYRVHAVNQAFCGMLGMEEHRLTGMTTPLFVHPEDRQACIELLRELFAGKIPSYKDQRRYINAREEIIWVDVFGTLVRDPCGKPLYVLAIAVDITEQKRAEEALHELSARLMRLQEEERRRIARELHDSTGQNLAALKLNLSRLDRAQLAPDLGGLVTDSLLLADRMLVEIRTLSYLLHPPLLEELGLASAIQAYVEGFRERSGIAVYLDIGENLGRHAPELETTIFRVIQEGLTNVYRHSGGTQCWITLRLEDLRLRLELRDDGAGLRSEVREDAERGTPVLGVGLSGMRERVRQLQGRLEIESNGSGCVVRSVFPTNGQRNG